MSCPLKLTELLRLCSHILSVSISPFIQLYFALQIYYSQSLPLCVRLSVCLSVAETVKMLLLFRPLVEFGDFWCHHTPLGNLPNVALFDFWFNPQFLKILSSLNWKFYVMRFTRWRHLNCSLSVVNRFTTERHRIQHSGDVRRLPVCLSVCLFVCPRPSISHCFYRATQSARYLL